MKLALHQNSPVQNLNEQNYVHKMNKVNKIHLAN